MTINPFTSNKDPLVEAVQNAQREGQFRRQAEAIVNEAFGVYSRNAVVNEHIASYDAAVEEVFSQLKEGVQIDELSKDFLKKQYLPKAKKEGDYYSMARTRSDTIADADRNERKFNNRFTGQVRARAKIRGKFIGDDNNGDKLKVKATKEEYEQIDEVKASWEKEGNWSKMMKRQERAYMKSKKAAKDYDRDGKIESGKDEYQGSRIRAAKMAGKLEEDENIDEGWASIGKGHAYDKFGDVNPNVKFYGKKPKQTKSGEAEAGTGWGKSSTSTKKTRFVKTVKEAEEQIDELSRDTLKSYIGSAVGRYGHHKSAAERDRRASDEYYDHNRKVSDDYSKRARDHERKEENRRKGIDRALKRLEEDEQLDEVSKERLKKYLDKIDDAEERGVRHSSKRRQSASLAIRKLAHSEPNTFNPSTRPKVVAKEDCDQLDEAKDSYAAYQRRMNAAPNWSKESDWSKKMKKQEREFMRAKGAAEKRKNAAAEKRDAAKDKIEEAETWFQHRTLDKFAKMDNDKKGKVMDSAADKMRGEVQKMLQDMRKKKEAEKSKQKLDEAPIGRKTRKGAARSLLARLADRQTMKEQAQIDEIVVQKSQIRPGETLGMAMNRLTGKTAIKNGRNDPTGTGFAGERMPAPLPPSKPTSMSSTNSTSWKSPSDVDQADTIRKSGNVPPVSKPTALPTMASGSNSVSSGNIPGIDSSSIVKGNATTPTFAATPKTNTNVDPGAIENLKRRTNTALEESVQVGDNFYRIV